MLLDYTKYVLLARHKVFRCRLESVLAVKFLLVSTELDIALVEDICTTVTTLQAVTWAGAARRIPRRRNSAGRQYARYCALGQGCKDPKPLQPIVE